eukprot:XP_015582577.1 protein-tyrosine-phosphatase MKP1 [Ricinus communis]
MVLDCVIDPNGNDIGNGSSNEQNRRYPVPLTPRSQQNFKARSCLPPLQPLAIARRSLDEWPKAGSDDLGEWPHQPTTPSGNKNGERLKLDLSSIQRNPDKNAGLVKRDKIAFFDKECSKVAEHVYLGGDAVAKDREILKQNGITHVLNCVGFVCPEYFKADFVYRTLWLQDSPSEDITSILYDVFDYFEDVREQGGRVFVHCCQGVSRSTSLVIAYLMWREGQSFDDAFQYVKSARGIADPNMGFACQLLQCQKRVHAFPLSPSSLLRLYRVAPHSPYDPLHLVPRMLNDPSPSALDSRGAFIIHIPSAIYIWIGKYCEAIMERDARGAVCQIVRYERAQGPIIVIKEGEEPAYFWDAFSNYLPLIEKSGNGMKAGESALKISLGERKVDAYNSDSISSDSSTSSKYFSESSLDSPSAASSSVLVSSSLSNFSNLSLLSSKTSSQPLSNTPEFHAISSMSNGPYQVTSSLSKTSPPSLAERRGSLSKSLKLPVMTENMRPTNIPPNSHTCQEDGARINKNNFSWCNTDSREIVLESRNDTKEGDKDSVQQCKLNLCSDRVVIADKCHKEASFVNNYDGPDRNCLLGKGLGCSTSNGKDRCSLKQPLVCQWPSLERIITFGVSNLDSKAAFAILGPATGLGRDENRILYFWIGRSYPFDESLTRLECSKGLMDGKLIDWNQVGCLVLTQMGLPKDITVKFIKEDEEPAEFLELLSAL